VRLQKALAEAGVGSRRKCEELILEGRVEVDGRVVSELGTRVDLTKQELRVDGDLLKRSKRLYYAVNKPTGVVSTNKDPAGRPRVIDLVASEERLFTVGRLDASSEGLILVTNDGELSNALAHPRYGVEKIYHVQVAGSPTNEQLDQLRKGIYLADGVVRVMNVQVKKRLKLSTVLEMVLDEGKNREIRRAMARIGHKVLRLKRIAIGSLRLGELPAGAYRPLTVQEVRKLYLCAEQASGGKSSKTGKPRRKRRGFRPLRDKSGAGRGVDAERRTSNVERPTSNERRKQKGAARFEGRGASHGAGAAQQKPNKTTGFVIDYDSPGEGGSSGQPTSSQGSSRPSHGGRKKHFGRKQSGRKHKGKRRPRS
jgi:23S rRNA pseudouridine2605 synthase